MYVCVRACVRAQSFSRANEMVERLKDQTNYVLDKCAWTRPDPTQT